MKMQLPPRSQGRQLTVNTRRLIIIGANGAGKTRFAASLAASLGDRAFRVSALSALYDRECEDSSVGSIDYLYHQAAAGSSLIRSDVRGAFERLCAMLINDMALELLAERLEGCEPRTSALQQIINDWETIFPDNKILLKAGRLLVDTGDGTSAYSTSRLSAGEKAVLYHLGAAAVAPRGAAIFVDSPEMFLHQSTIKPLWDRIERLRHDCTFIYITHDISFAANNTGGDILWVKNCDTDAGTWTYELMQAAEGLPEDVYLAILGERKPVLFIEGDARHSYDARLYPMIFPDYTVKPLGSCDRVIESTRTFNALKAFHNLDARGIVDRDRRDKPEVDYLRTRNIMVPDVAEIENIFMIENVVRAVAAYNGRDPKVAFDKVRRNLLSLFRANIERQALEHTRHYLKIQVQRRIDGKFDGIEALENHTTELLQSLNPRHKYDELLERFNGFLKAGDYRSVLRVFNFKSMISETRVASITGAGNDDRRSYIEFVLDLIRRGDTPHADVIRSAIRNSFE